MSDTSSEAYDPVMEPLVGISNFYNWKFTITLQLNVLKLNGIVQGKIPRPPSPTTPASASSPSDETPEQTEWDNSSIRALCFIHDRVSPTVVDIIGTFATAPDAWKYLMDSFHKRDPTSLLQSLNTISNLRLGNADSIHEFLTTFSEAWSDLRMRTGDAPPAVEGTQNSLETVLAGLARSEQSKIEFLLDSLPSELWNIRFSLRNRYGADLRFSHVYNSLTDVHHNREQAKEIARRAEAAEAATDCTWCRSRGYESVGHVWKECGRLRQFKSRKVASRGTG